MLGGGYDGCASVSVSVKKFAFMINLVFNVIVGEMSLLEKFEHFTGLLP